MHVMKLVDDYGIDLLKSSPYYPYRNGPTEATNKDLLRVLNTIIYEEAKRWIDFFLTFALWAYRNSKRTQP